MHARALQVFGFISYTALSIECATCTRVLISFSVKQLFRKCFETIAELPSIKRSTVQGKSFRSPFRCNIDTCEERLRNSRIFIT